MPYNTYPVNVPSTTQPLYTSVPVSMSILVTFSFPLSRISLTHIHTSIHMVVNSAQVFVVVCNFSRGSYVAVSFTAYSKQQSHVHL